MPANRISFWTKILVGGMATLIVLGAGVSQRHSLKAVVTGGTSLEVMAAVYQLKGSGSAGRAEALRTIGRYGQGSAAAVPALIEALDDHDVHIRRLAVDALANVGPSAIPEVAMALQDDRPIVRQAAAETLGEFGVKALPTLVSSLDHEDAKVRHAAVRSIFQLQPRAQAAVPRLVMALDDADSQVRGEAASALARGGPAVVPRLTPVFKSENRETRLLGIAVLQRMRFGIPATATPHLMSMLNDSSADVRLAAIEALAKIGPDAKDATAALKHAAATETDSHVKLRANAALRSIDANRP